MKNILSIAFILLLITQSSCVSYLTPALGGATSLAYIPRPTVTDSVKELTTFSAGYISGQPFDGHLKKNLGQVSFKRGHSLKNINFGYGVFGVFGNAKFIDQTIYSLGTNTPIGSFEKSIYGAAINTTIGFHQHVFNENVTFRILNWENSISIEGGDYVDYRKQLYSLNLDTGQTILFVSQLSKIYTTGLSSELYVNKIFDDSDIKLGGRIFLGFSPNYSNSYRAVNRQNLEPVQYRTVLSGSLFVKYKKWFFLNELAIDANFVAKTSFGYCF